MALGLRRLGVVSVAFSAFKVFRVFRTFRAFRVFTAFSFAQTSVKYGELPINFRTDSTPSLSCRRWQSERRHVDQPRQRNDYQVLQGGYPPEGPHCAAEVLRAEAKTAGNSQRACKPRNPHRRPPTPGPGPQARRSLVTFHRWKVTRRRRDQKTKTFRVTRKRHPPPTKAGPENKTHQSNDKNAKTKKGGPLS